MAGKTNGEAALMRTNNPKCGVDMHVLNVCIAKGCKVTELCLYYDFISYTSGERL